MITKNATTKSHLKQFKNGTPLGVCNFKGEPLLFFITNENDIAAYNLINDDHAYHVRCNIEEIMGSIGKQDALGLLPSLREVFEYRHK